MRKLPKSHWLVLRKYHKNTPQAARNFRTNPGQKDCYTGPFSPAVVRILYKSTMKWPNLPGKWSSLSWFCSTGFKKEWQFANVAVQCMHACKFSFGDSFHSLSWYVCCLFVLIFSHFHMLFSSCWCYLEMAISTDVVWRLWFVQKIFHCFLPPLHL